MCLLFTSSWCPPVTGCRVRRHVLTSWPRTKASGSLGLPAPSTPSFVGPNQEDVPRNVSAGSSDFANQQISLPPQLPVNSHPDNPLTHICSVCQRAFSTKTGLGVHMRSKHPSELDRVRLRIDVKARWCDEEVLLLAKKEAELVVLQKSRFINQDLARMFPTRSLEAIKKARQKPEYRNHVRQFVDELETGPSRPLTPQVSSVISLRSQPEISSAQPTSSTVSLSSSDLNHHFLDFIKSIPPPRTTSYQCTVLISIVNDATESGKDITLARLSSYLLDIWPVRHRNTLPPRPRESQPPVSRRQIRRQEYARMQRNWDKHQGRCIKSILDGPNNSIEPPQEVMEPYWREVMERESTSAPQDEVLGQDLNSIWEPITVEEIGLCQLPLSSSPGPDGITPRQLRAIPDALMVRILNLILWCGKIPQHLGQAKTIFLPKKDQSSEPGDFRPITIPSVVTRLLHGILARRLRNAINLDPRQRAFQPTDGCADNTTLVDLLLRDHHQRYASCYIASLDVSKAFDSVSHESLFGTMRSYGFPNGFIDYLKHFYTSSSTRLFGEGWISGEIRPKRGVKQGDPLSPMLFNITIDRLLKRYSNDIGCAIGTSKINALAFADDLLLCASTPQGLQTLIDDSVEFLASCGLTLNSSKCLTISIKGQPKQKITVVEERTFKIASNSIPALRRGEEWKYLGIFFSTDGRCKYKASQDLCPKLEKLTKAPLKPQQRLHALRTVVIPQLYHKLTLGNIMIGCLNKTDRLIRSFVRKWLDLPKDTPSAFFHAPIEHGGLGIPSIRWNGPCLRKSRLLNLQLPNLRQVAVANTFIATELDRVERRLRHNGRLLEDQEAISNYWSSKLHASVDGFGLREAFQHKQAHRWIREPSRLLRGRDFIQCIKLRINALPTRSRTTRGRHEQDRMCRAGCQAPETLNHVVQQCHRTHASRIERHNSALAYVERGVSNRGFTTVKEPTIRTTEGIKKPDLVAISGREAVIVDAQIVTDGRSLDEAHNRKKALYNTTELKQEVRRKYNVEKVTVTTVTLSWRGIWSGSSINELIQNNILSKKDSALISTRVAIGSIRCFRIFNATTMVNYRTGIG